MCLDDAEGKGVLRPVLCPMQQAPEAVMEFKKCGYKGSVLNILTTIMVYPSIHTDLTIDCVSVIHSTN